MCSLGGCDGFYSRDERPLGNVWRLVRPTVVALSKASVTSGHKVSGATALVA